MGVVVRRYIDIPTIIINFPYSTCISLFWGAAASLLLCSFLKCFFGLYIYMYIHTRFISYCGILNFVYFTRDDSKVQHGIPYFTTEGATYRQARTVM